MSASAARALVFVTSASVLVLEILAGRLLAPYVGVTIEAFTGIIGTVLAAIALGSWLGGRAADRTSPTRLLGPLVVAGGILTLLAPPVVTTLGPELRGTAPVQIVLLTALGFFAPAVVLSAVSPVVVKLQLADLSRTGSVVGQFSAVGTAGALFGTFVTGFVLLASLPTRPIVFGIGIALILVGVGLHWRLVGWATGALVALLVVGAAGGAAALAVTGPCDVETTYSCAFVEVDPNRPSGRTLWLDTARHSYVDIEDPSYLGFRYIRLMADASTHHLATRESAHILSVGGGGFTLPQWAAARYPGARQTVLELDGRLVELVDAELGLDRADLDQILIGDARSTIREVDGPVDLVLADAFGGFVVPWHLTTNAFFSEIKSRMASDGVLVMNVIDYPPLRFVRAEAATLTAVFDHVVVVAPPDYLAGETGGNFIFIAANDPAAVEHIVSGLASRDGREVVLEDVKTWSDGARVLTDDFAPVDQLISRP